MLQCGVLQRMLPFYGSAACNLAKPLTPKRCWAWCVLLCTAHSLPVPPASGLLTETAAAQPLPEIRYSPGSTEDLGMNTTSSPLPCMDTSWLPPGVSTTLCSWHGQGWGHGKGSS